MSRDALSPDSVPRADDMPLLGLGTYRNKDDQCVESVRTALEMDYRHVETASMYRNEQAVGEGLAAIPKATGEDHIRDNWESPAPQLSEEEVARIDAIDRRERLIDPGFGPDTWQ
jgi:diketogulonate reductase-like aldo/keto reductase